MLSAGRPYSQRRLTILPQTTDFFRSFQKIDTSKLDYGNQQSTENQAIFIGSDLPAAAGLAAGMYNVIKQ